MADAEIQGDREMKTYILNGHIPETDDNFEACARMTRTVAKTSIGDVRISTVFLGMDHNFFGNGPPLLFETMIFGGPHDGYQERCSTWEEAEKQHEKAVELARAIQLKSGFIL